MEFDLEKSSAILARTPGTLKSLLQDLSDDLTKHKSEPDAWSPFDVIGHLIHGEETDWIPRARIILSGGGDKTFEPFDRYAQLEKSRGRKLNDLLDRFAELRKDNLETLRSWHLSADQLKLRGIHPELGVVNLSELLATWVVHDLNHVKQIVTALARKYEENVGAWKAYLSILK